MNDTFSVSQQLALLLEHGIDSSGQFYTVQKLSDVSGISDQTLLNILNGTTTSPRLKTARAICQVYDLSLDYFDLDTSANCRAYLERHRQRHIPLIREIDSSVSQLPPDGQRQITRVLFWIKAARSEM
jgi:transcriptional regulator with XRE-family HTH domain